MGEFIGKILAALRRLRRAGLALLRAVATWWRPSLREVAFALIALGYFILWLIGGGPPPPSAPAASA